MSSTQFEFALFITDRLPVMTHSCYHDGMLGSQTKTLGNRQKSLRYDFVIVVESHMV